MTLFWRDFSLHYCVTFIFSHLWQRCLPYFTPTIGWRPFYCIRLLWKMDSPPAYHAKLSEKCKSIYSINILLLKRYSSWTIWKHFTSAGQTHFAARWSFIGRNRSLNIPPFWQQCVMIIKPCFSDMSAYLGHVVSHTSLPPSFIKKDYDIYMNKNVSMSYYISTLKGD